MASTLSDLVKTLAGTRDALLPSADIFPPVNVDQLADELSLGKRGAVDGAENVPGEADLAAVAESDIEAECRKRWSTAVAEFRVQDELYKRRIRSGLIAVDLKTSILATARQALSDFQVQASQDLGDLAVHLRDARDAELSLQRFRRANHLDRPPRSAKNVSLKVAFIILVLLFETGLNGGLFATGSATGYIGGAVQAILLSLVNVGIAVAAAMWAFPNTRHARAYRRLTGFVAVGGYLLLATILNLGIAHFRDLYVRYDGNVSLSAVWEALVHRPFALQDATSLLLAVLGFMLSVGVVVDVNGLLDPYPGYGALGRLRDEAFEKYTTDRAAGLRALQVRRDDAIHAMSSVLKDVQSKMFDVDLAVTGRAQLRQQITSYAAHLEDVASRLIQRYREANRRARSTAPPQLFHKPSAFTADIASIVWEDVPYDPAGSREISSEMAELITAMSIEFDKQAARYPSIANLLDEAPTQAAP